MTDQLTPPAIQIGAGVADLLQLVRGDIHDSEDRLSKAMEKLEERLTNRIERGSLDHAKLHQEEGAERRRVTDKITEFIRNAELADAKRDGVLGVIRFTVELISRHAARLGALATALGLLIGFITGNLDIRLGQ